jgi:hypothetical protein
MRISKKKLDFRFEDHSDRGVEMNALDATMHDIFDIVLLNFAREDTFVPTRAHGRC